MRFGVLFIIVINLEDIEFQKSEIGFFGPRLSFDIKNEFLGVKSPIIVPKVHSPTCLYKRFHK